MRGGDATNIRVEGDCQAESIVLPAATNDLASQEPRQQRRMARAHGDHRLGADRNLFIGVDEHSEAADIFGYAEGVNKRQIAVVPVHFHAELQGAPRGSSAVATGWLEGRSGGTDTCGKARGIGQSWFVSSWPRPGVRCDHYLLRFGFSESLSSVHLNLVGCTHNDPIRDFSI